MYSEGRLRDTFFQCRKRPPVAGKNPYNSCYWEEGTECIKLARDAHTDRWKGDRVTGHAIRLDDGGDIKEDYTCFIEKLQYAKRAERAQLR